MNLSGKSISQLQEEINERVSAIHNIQEQCSHPEPCLTKVAGSNTGNYDPSADSYWYDFKCSLCGKSWREDQ